MRLAAHITWGRFFCTGDSFYTVNPDTAEESIAEILKEDIYNLSEEHILCFDIPGVNLTREFCTELAYALQNKNAYCSAYQYTCYVYPDKVRITASQNPGEYNTFSYYFGQKIYDVTADDAAEEIIEVITDIGLSFSGDEKYTFAVSVPADVDPYILISQIKSKYFHPYEQLWSETYDVYNEGIKITINTCFTSYDDYINYTPSYDQQIILIDEADAYEYLTNFMKEKSSETDIIAYNNLYIKTSHKWTSTELSQFVKRLNNGDYWRIYLVNGYSCGDDWIQIDIRRKTY